MLFAPFLLQHRGTVALTKCLFGDLGGSGFYFGSDGVRSPLHFMRNPGEPAYDGAACEPGDGWTE